MRFKKASKKLLSALLSLSMIAGLLPAGVLATEAQAAAEETTVVIAGSDFQTQSNNQNGEDTTSLNAILKSIKTNGGYSSADGFLFAGDYDQYTHNSKNETEKGITQLTEAVNDAITGISHYVYVQGNHDYRTDKLSSFGANDPASGEYGVFVLHEDEYPDSAGNSSSIQNIADQLDAYLDEKVESGFSKPIFVVSHLPLHYSYRTYNNGNGVYAKYLVDVMNEAGADGLDIIFMFGHNHSSDHDSYLGGSSVYLTPGDSIWLCQPGDQKAKPTEHTLNFTYMTAGYVGYSNDDADNTLTMTVFEITDDQVTVARYDANGKHNLKSAGKYNASNDDSGYGYPVYDNVVKSPQIISLVDPVTQTDNGVSVTALGLTGLKVTKNANPTYNTDEYSAYVSYEIVPEGYNQGDEATVTVPVDSPFEAGRSVVVLDNGEIIATTKIKNGKVTFTTDHFSEYAIAQLAEVAAKWIPIPAKTYKLDINGVAANKKYLIVNTNNGTGYALTNNNGTPGRTEVTITGSGANSVITVTDDTKINWIFSSTTNPHVRNNNTYLSPGNGSLFGDSVELTISNQNYGAYRILRSSGSTTYYVKYTNNNWTGASGTTNRTVYLYELDEETSTVGGYAIAEGEDRYTVSIHATADQALAAVKNGITVSTATNALDADKTPVADDDVSWDWVDGTFQPGVEGSYTVEIKYAGVLLDTVEVEVSAAASIGEWIDISTTQHNYTLDTDGYEPGSETGSDNRYLFVASDAAYAMNADGSGVVPVTINGYTATVDSRDYEWYIYQFGSGGSTRRVITKNSDTWLYHADYTLHLGTDNNGYWTIDEGKQNQGLYRFYNADGGSTWYLRYHTDGYMGVTTSIDRYVRLYKYDGSNTTSRWIKIVGDSLYKVDLGTTKDNALAKVQNGIIGYINNSGSDSGMTTLPDSELTWTWLDTYKANTPGDYRVQISYEGKTLGVVTVEVVSRPIDKIEVAPDEGTVPRGSGASITTGSNLTVTYKDGSTATVPVTVGMLSGDFNVNKNGTYKNLTITYAGKTIEGYTLHVVNVVGNDFPTYPNPGSIEVGKSATGQDFQNTGVARVELSTSGLPTEKGADVIIMLDTSSSMEDYCIDHKIKNHENCQSDSRADVLEESLEQLIAQFKAAKNAAGEPMDLRVAIADFDGFYTNASSPYYYNSKDKLNGMGSYDAAVNANDIYTGSKKLDAEAFIKASDLQEEYTLTYHSGTNYDYAFDAIYQLGTSVKAANAAAGRERDLFVIFLSDGAPYQYNYFLSDADDSWDNWLMGNVTDEMYLDGANRNYFDATNGNKHRMAEAVKGDPNRQYTVIRKNDSGLEDVLRETNVDNMYTVPGLGATTFSIAFCPADDGNTDMESMVHVIKNTATPDTDSIKHYYEVSSATELTNAFTSIGSEIAYAAQNAYFVDQMGSAYDLQINPTVNTNANGGGTTTTVDTDITVTTYPIYTKAQIGTTVDGHKVTADDVGKTYGTGTVSETVSFTVTGNNIIAESTAKTEADGNILNNGVICAQYFFYNTTTSAKDITLKDGSTYSLPAETFYWDIGTINEQQFELSYAVYLSGSMEGAVAEGDSYETNNYATLHYTNYLGNDVEQSVASPSMPWGGANVSYGFYLVDSNGNPLLAEGTAADNFLTAYKVTQPVVYKSIKLNSGETVLSTIADDVLPDGYTLYDTTAKYTVNVRSGNGGGSSWEIDGSHPSSTYVTGYAGQNEYSNATPVSDGSYDYTHTTVWFAVVWTVGTVPDVVVIDYGLPVDINVMGNDMFGDYGTLAGIGQVSSIPEDTHTTNLDTTAFGNTLTGDHGSIVVNGNEVRYTPADMTMNSIDTFAYAAQYTGAENGGYYYGTVTVVPATTIYYEDSFVTFNAGGTEGWSNAGATAAGVTQAEDRPGEYSLSTLDANNIYGYDPAYGNYITYSLGSAKTVTVDEWDAGNWPTASFSFTGTGFDLISLTSNKTGLIKVDVTKADDASVKYGWVVDTYYGYKKDRQSEGYRKVSGIYGSDEKWHITIEKDADGNVVLYEVPGTVDAVEENPVSGDTFVVYEEVYTWTTVGEDASNSLYQIPVIKSEPLAYGTYNVVITPMYSPVFDHNDGSTSYDFYLDAIRIYDPMGDLDNEYYVQDDQGWPAYFEVRNILIDNAETSGEEEISGAVFIDGLESSSSVDDYTNYGPNNEVYLSSNQAVAFTLTRNTARTLADIAIGVKAVEEDTAQIDVAILDSIGGEVENTRQFTTATDMYYSIMDYVEWTNSSSDTSKIIVISNAGKSLVSLTNIRLTYQETPEDNGTATAFALWMNEENTQTAVTYMTARYLSSLPVADSEVDPPEVEEPEVEEPEDNTPSAPGKPGGSSKPNKPSYSHGSSKPNASWKNPWLTWIEEFMQFWMNAGWNPGSRY